MSRWSQEKADWVAECEHLEDSHGTLRPADMVAFAKSSKTALHAKFEWNDKKAGHQHRLQQARELICQYQTQPIEDGPKVRGWVSLAKDRAGGDGYRRIEKVLSSGSLRKQLLETALRDMEMFQQRYSTLQELVLVFEAMKKTKVKVAKKSPRKRSAAKKSSRKKAPRKAAKKKGGRKRGR